ncbi:acyltransferase [Uliginosibacterium sp. H3]|uniref:Acyltransferase n=1 Tax=Uliginosibacterium silvisoli TaxID=3114758 RepID=A0ABU6K8A2_9RHOO|nr:acyltransferase [Uliginosibacterium sp. H3]
MHTESRNHSLDATRLLAALCVVGLHVGTIDTVSQAWNLVRIEMRWAVPFFFILTGLHLGSDLSLIPTRIALLVPRLIRMLVAASLLFLPVLIISRGFAGALQEVFSFDFLRSGSYFHLWFISALIIGLLLLQTLLVSNAKRLLKHVSALLILMALLSGSYSVILPPGYGLEGTFAFFRHLLALPCLFIGLVLARSPTLANGSALALAFGGAALQLLEVLMLQRYAGTSPFAHQFLLGTLPMAVGLISLARNHATAISGRLSQWGRQHSLGIYIVHPLWMLVYARLPLPQLASHEALGPLIATAVIFCASLVSMLVLERIRLMIAQLIRRRQDAHGGVHAIRY